MSLQTLEYRLVFGPYDGIGGSYSVSESGELPPSGLPAGAASGSDGFTPSTRTALKRRGAGHRALRGNPTGAHAQTHHRRAPAHVAHHVSVPAHLPAGKAPMNKPHVWRTTPQPAPHAPAPPAPVMKAPAGFPAAAPPHLPGGQTPMQNPASFTPPQKTWADPGKINYGADAARLSGAPQAPSPSPIPPPAHLPGGSLPMNSTASLPAATPMTPSPPPPQTGPMPTGGKEDRAMRLMGRLVNVHGWTPAGAAIAAGNAEQESEIKSDGPPGDLRLGWPRRAEGMFQWREARRERMQAFAAERGKDWKDFDTQTDFFAKEALEYYPAWATQQDLSSAGRIGKIFEGYGDDSTATRVRNAARWLGYWNNAQQSVADNGDNVSDKIDGRPVPPGTVAPGLRDLERATEGLPGGRARITSENDSFHHRIAPNSLHARGLAFDQVLNDPGQSEAATRFMRESFRSAGLSDRDFLVINEYLHPSPFSTGGHIHSQFNTADAARRYHEFSVRDTPQPVFIGDSIAHGLRGRNGLGDTRVGRSPREVLSVLRGLPDDSLKNRSVIISTGSSNAPRDTDAVLSQIEAAKSKGADPSRITVLGVGPRQDFDGVNEKLKRISKAEGAKFQPLLETGGDLVHPKNYGALMRAIASSEGSN